MFSTTRTDSFSVELLNSLFAAALSQSTLHLLDSFSIDNGCISSFSLDVWHDVVWFLKGNIMKVFSLSSLEPWGDSLFVAYHIHLDQSFRSTIKSDIDFVSSPLPWPNVKSPKWSCSIDQIRVATMLVWKLQRLFPKPSWRADLVT